MRTLWWLVGFFSPTHIFEASLMSRRTSARSCIPALTSRSKKRNRGSLMLSIVRFSATNVYRKHPTDLRIQEAEHYNELPNVYIYLNLPSISRTQSRLSHVNLTMQNDQNITLKVIWQFTISLGDHSCIIIGNFSALPYKQMQPFQLNKMQSVQINYIHPLYNGIDWEHMQCIGFVEIKWTDVKPNFIWPVSA